MRYILNYFPISKQSILSFWSNNMWSKKAISKFHLQESWQFHRPLRSSWRSRCAVWLDFKQLVHHTNRWRWPSGFLSSKHPQRSVSFFFLGPPRCQDLSVFSSFPFKKFSLFHLVFPTLPILNKNRLSLSSLFLEVYLSFILCLWEVFPKIPLSSKTNKTHVYPWILGESVNRVNRQMRNILF